MPPQPHAQKAGEAGRGGGGGPINMPWGAGGGEGAAVYGHGQGSYSSSAAHGSSSSSAGRESSSSSAGRGSSSSSAYYGGHGAYLNAFSQDGEEYDEYGAKIYRR